MTGKLIYVDRECMEKLSKLNKKKESWNTVIRKLLDLPKSRERRGRPATAKKRSESSDNSA